MSRLTPAVVVMVTLAARAAAADDDDGWPERPTPPAHMALVAELRGGLVLVNPGGDAAMGRGGLGGLSFRGLVDNLVDHRLGIAFAGDFELGHAASEMQGQARVGIGVGGLLGPLSASVLGGGALGSLGPAGSADAFVEANASFTIDRRVGVWLLAARTFSSTVDHDRLELRLALPKWSDGSGSSIVLGVRRLAFGQGAGTAHVVTVGWGTIQSEPDYIDPRFF